MNTPRAIAGRPAAVILALLALPPAAAGQDSSAEQQGGARTQGPMTVELVKSGFLVTPEVKITSFDNQTSELVGTDGGWLAEKSFFIGGGGYWLVNNSHDRGLGYGGIVLGIFTPVDRPFSFGVKTLMGGGEATVTRSVAYYVEGPQPRSAPQLRTTNVRYHEGVGVFEPEANAVFRVADHFRISVGVGYRWTGHDHGGPGGLDGATGTVGLQIGGG